ncbi:MAG: hypothetical protein ACI86H_000004 [bacterium]|jgi:hypothetical protein
MTKYIVTFLTFFSIFSSFGYAQTKNSFEYKHQWRQQFYDLLNGKRSLLYAREMKLAKLSFVDIDADGDLDLFMGKEDGQIAFFENEGSNEAPSFVLKSQEYKAIFSRRVGRKISRIQQIINVGSRSAPTFSDIDSDGDLDLLIGSGTGELWFFRNIGNNLIPTFEFVTNRFQGLSLGKNLVPIFADINLDRRTDLIVGNKQGKVWFLINEGTRRSPVFNNSGIQEVKRWKGFYISASALKSIKSKVSTTAKYEKLKALKNYQFSNENEFLPVIENILGRDETARLKSFIFKLTAKKHEKKNASPSLFDWDGDGDLDLLVGERDGTISYYINNGDQFTPDWAFYEQNFKFIDIGGDASPVFIQFSPQQKTNVFIGTSTSVVAQYELRKSGKKGYMINSLAMDHFNNKIPSKDLLKKIEGLKEKEFIDRISFLKELEKNLGKVNLPQYQALILKQANLQKISLWNLTENYFLFFKFVVTGERASIASGDLDGDGDLDLIIGEHDGNLNYYRNDSIKGKNNWIKITENLVPMTGMKNSTPVLGDIDGDGDLDLIVGGQSGRIAFIENQGRKNAPKWVLKSYDFFNIDVGSNSVPRLFDFDLDKDLDLIVGNYAGRVIFYRNQGNQKKANYVLESTRFTSIRSGRNAVPSFYNWNQDQFFDLVVGDSSGSLKMALAPIPLALEKWPKKDNSWSIIDAVILSHPFFIDFNQDKKTDLLLGNGFGDIQLFINTAVQKTTPVLVRKNQKSNSLDKKNKTIVQNKDDLLRKPIIKKPIQDTTENLPDNIPQQKELVVADPVFVKKSKKLIEGLQLKRATPVLADLDDDGDFDMVIGSKEGGVFLYLNDGDKTESSFVAISDPLIKINGYRNTAPVLVDLDKDGDFDLVIGTASGRLLYYENIGSAQSHKFQFKENYFKNLRVGKNATPSFIDFDKDGDIDLIVGNTQGKIVLIENQTKDTNIPKFVILHRDYLGIDVGLASAPKFFDLNNDKILELVIGSDSGKIYFFKKASQETRWQWDQISKNTKMPPPGSFPFAIDLDNDGDQDLVVGTDSGKIIYYQNDAVTSEEE